MFLSEHRVVGKKFAQRLRLSLQHINTLIDFSQQPVKQDISHTHWHLHTGQCPYFVGGVVLSRSDLAILAAIQYWENHSHLVASVHEPRASSSRSQARAASDCKRQMILTVK